MSLRINIRKLKQLLWLLGVLAFAYAGWTFFDIYSAKQAGDYTARKLKVFEEILRRDIGDESRGQHDKAFYPAERYARIWQTLVNGELRPSETDAEASEDVEPPKFVVPELGTIVDLAAVLYSNEPLGRFVALSYKDETAGAAAQPGKVRRLHLSEGDPLKPPYDAAPYNGRILAIGLQEVRFQWGEGEVMLTPQLGTSGDGLPFNQFSIPEWEDPTASVTEAPAHSIEVKPGHWVLGTEDLGRIKKDPQSFLAEELSVRTITPPGGGHSSLEVTQDPPPGSLAAAYGVKANDRLISINGIPMTSLSAAANWFKSNDSLPYYDIVYESAGAVKTMTVHVK